MGFIYGSLEFERMITRRPTVVCITCQVEPAGVVPSETKVELSWIISPFDIIIFESAANGMAVCLKQSSVKFDSSGHKRYWRGAVEGYSQTFCGL